MSDPILLFLFLDAVALLAVGGFGGALPLPLCGLVATTLCGLGVLLCLPPLLFHLGAVALTLPVGPAGLPLRLGLDPLSSSFLFITFAAGAGVAAFQATSSPLAPAAATRLTASSVAGAALCMLAADGVALAIGAAIACAAIRQAGADGRRHYVLLVPFLLLAAVCLLAPPGIAPRFDAIRAGPVEFGRTTAAAGLAVIAATSLARAGRCWPQGALAAAAAIPLMAYLALRLAVDLGGAAAQGWWGVAILLLGGSAATLEGWRSAADPDIDGAVAALVRRQGGLALAGIGLAVIARAADLPGAAAFALEATFLAAIGGGLAGALASLAAQALAAGAGTCRLSRMGGLAHTMPGTSIALAAALLALAALPPGLGFATLWLLFQSILSAPRTGALLGELPLALLAAALALSAALATAASVRLAGIALLGRPRTPRGAGAHEGKSSRMVFSTLGGLALLAGVLPGPLLWLLADPAIRGLAGLPQAGRTGLALLSSQDAAPAYLALPVSALLALMIGATVLAQRWRRKESGNAGAWSGGMSHPPGLPFGEPTAQSAGEGFLPKLPAIRLPGLPRIPAFALPRPPAAATGLWSLVAAFIAFLLVLAVAG